MNKMFITIRADDGKELDPFSVGDTLNNSEFKIDKTEALKSGDYLITTRDEVTAGKLLNLQHLDDGTEITTELHRSLNGCKGVIRCDAIKTKTESEIQEHLQGQKVCRVQAKGNGLYIITFELARPPKVLKVGALDVKVNTFYPRPMLCKNCFVYGHVKEHCRNKAACQWCGQYHINNCETVKCRNCNGGHMPTDPKCPVWRQEMAINRLMVDSDVPAAKARAVYRKENKKRYITAPKVAKEARMTTEHKDDEHTKKRKANIPEESMESVELSDSDVEVSPTPPKQPPKKAKTVARNRRVTK